MRRVISTAGCSGRAGRRPASRVSSLRIRAARPASAIALIALGLLAAAGVALPAQAQSYTPGRAAWTAGGGKAGSAGMENVAVIGQPASGCAIGGPASFSAGILAALIEGFTLRERPSSPIQIQAGAPLALEAEVVSQTPADSVVLHYRWAGRPDYAALTMQTLPNGDWSGAIPPEAVQLRGVEYYLEARGAQRTSHLPAWDYEDHPLQQVVHATDSDGGGALRLAARACRMVSLPAMLAEGSPEALFADDLGEGGSGWRCGRWSPEAGGYREMGDEGSEPFAPGRAFFLFSEQARQADFSGATVYAPSDEGYPIALAPGWNMIGNPYAYPIALEDALVRRGEQVLTVAQAAASRWIESQPLHAFDGEQYGADTHTLSPWSGYFVANLGDTPLELILPAREAYRWQKPRPMAAAPSTEPDWTLQISARAGEGAPARLQLGVSAGAAEGWDACDQLVPPPALVQSLMARSVNDRLPEGLQTLQRDLRPPLDEGHSWTIELVAGDAGSLGLSWELVGELPAGYGARLIDLQSEIWVDCPATGSYDAAIAEPGTLSFLLTVGTQEWIEEQSEFASSAGEHFAIRTIGSNPHRGDTRLRLVLQQPEIVSLKAYDANGRLIRTLGDRELQAGVHLMHWDGRTDQGSAAPAGVYFMRLTGAGREVVTRSVLVR